MPSSASMFDKHSVYMSKILKAKMVGTLMDLRTSSLFREAARTLVTTTCKQQPKMLSE